MLRFRVWVLSLSDCQGRYRKKNWTPGNSEHTLDPQCAQKVVKACCFESTTPAPIDVGYRDVAIQPQKLPKP